MLQFPIYIITPRCKSCKSLLNDINYPVLPQEERHWLLHGTLGMPHLICNNVKCNTNRNNYPCIVLNPNGTNLLGNSTKHFGNIRYSSMAMYNLCYYTNTYKYESFFSTSAKWAVRVSKRKWAGVSCVYALKLLTVLRCLLSYFKMLLSLAVIWIIIVKRVTSKHSKIMGYMSIREYLIFGFKFAPVVQ